MVTILLYRVKLVAFNDLDENFRALLNKLRLDEIGNHVKSDIVILMVGARSFDALKRKKDKSVKTKRTVCVRMRILGRLYLNFKGNYASQSEISLPKINENAGDIFHRDGILILSKAINNMCERQENCDDDGIISQGKNGLKITMLNTLKKASKYLIGYYMMKREDEAAQEVIDFLKSFGVLRGRYFRACILCTE